MKNRDPRIPSARNRIPAALGPIGILATLGTIGIAILLLAYPALHLKAFLATGGMVAVLFAGAVPGLLTYRENRHRRTAQRKELFLDDPESVAGVGELQRLFEKAEAALSWTRRKDTSLAVLLIDLNGFESVNDSFGPGVGDEVMQAVAERLKSAIRIEDTVAQLGGDEFVILQVGLTQPHGARSLAARLTQSLSEPYQVGDLRIDCGASIGVAIAPIDGLEWETLLAHAESARRRAKAEGNNTARFFEAGLDAAFQKRLKLEAEMRRALDMHSFQLAFQPLFRSKDRQLIGFEALLRWPAGWEQQSPSIFIPVAEECGLIGPMGVWVLESACKLAATWTQPLKLSVNLSPIQFRRGDIVAAVKQALSKSGLDPARLELEVTESLWDHDPDGVIEQLMRLRAMGVTIALDDFGTGSSSLSSLWKFPIDAVKIDRSFVSRMNLDPKADSVVKTIVALGKSLDLTVTAEGVETRAQADALIAAGCDLMQGYLYSRPLSPTSHIF